MATTPASGEQNAGEECCVCLTTPAIGDCFVLPCTHTLCASCVRAVGEKQGLCPLCKKPFTLDQATPALDAAGALDVFCFDTSTSMWWSDLAVPIFGWSRLHVAQAMAEQLLVTRRTEHARAGRPYSVCVSRFDSDWGLLLNPTRVTTAADERLVLRAINGLAATGQYTAFFDSYLRLCRYLEAAPRFRALRLQVFFFTDGQNNLDAKGGTAGVPDALKGMERKLHLVQYIVNIGGDVPRTRKLADMINAEYVDASSSNFEEKARAIALALAPIQVPHPQCILSTAVAASVPTLQQPQPQPQQPSTTTAVSAIASALEHLPHTPSHAPAAATTASTVHGTPIAQ